MSSAPVSEGEIVAGRYRIDKWLAAGGMGVVFSATHIHLGERVAIKFLALEHASREDYRVRFLREAQAAARVRSEHVARVSDVGALESGAPYMVMELLEGHDLSGFADRTERVDVATAVDYVLQAGEAIAEAHALGIVHRDLKPSNLFLSTRPDGSACVKVLDFGISKIAPPSHQVEAAQLTKSNGILGSPLYMSPEQMASARSVDLRTDIWALGSIVFELLVGAPPFKADTLPELCAAILTHPAPSLRALRSEVPPGLADVIGRCLEKDARVRYANMGDLASALLPFAPPRAWLSVERIQRLTRSLPKGDGASSVATSGASAVSAPPPAMSSWGRTSPTEDLDTRAVTPPHATGDPFRSFRVGLRGWAIGIRLRDTVVHARPRAEVPASIDPLPSAPGFAGAASTPPATAGKAEADASTPAPLAPISALPSASPAPPATAISARVNRSAKPVPSAPAVKKREDAFTTRQ